MSTGGFTIYDSGFTNGSAPGNGVWRSDKARTTHHAPRPATHAFSLIEILVTIGLLSLIILGLLSMFNQTQRAFRSSITQTDVLESGRAVMDMLAREIEQMVPSEMPDILLKGQWYRNVNFFVEPSPGFNSPPFYQALPGVNFNRTNFVQRFFFLSKLNQDLIGTGYLVVPDDGNACVGTLYRFSAVNPRSAPISVNANFLSACQLALQNAKNGLPVTNMNRIADGIVHLRLRAYATNGSLIVALTTTTPPTNGFLISRYPFPTYTNVWNTIVTNSVYSVFDPLQTAAYFMKEAVPAQVELEMGVLEPQVLQRYRGIGSSGPRIRAVADAQRNYLSNHVANVHIFRQRVPIRNVDFRAYP
jgi:type II secretory pathway pseudopilin PulG